MPPGISRQIILLLIPTTIHHHMKLQRHTSFFLSSTEFLSSYRQASRIHTGQSRPSIKLHIHSADHRYSKCSTVVVHRSENRLRSSITHHPSCRCLWRPCRARLAHSRLRAVTPWRCSWLNSMTKMVISVLIIITQLNYTGWNSRDFDWFMCFSTAWSLLPYS